LLDLAIDQDRPLAFGNPLATAHRSPGHDGIDQVRFPGWQYWTREQLAQARAAIEYLIFEVLTEYLETVEDTQTPEHNWYGDLFEVVRGEPQTITLNYDILLDTVLFQLAEKRCGAQARPDYGCDIQTGPYRDRSRVHGRLLKLHGSLNWLYCPSCRRLDIGMCNSHSTVCGVLKELYNNRPALEEHYRSRATTCQQCGTPLGAVMITPTRVKDYRNPHIQSVWYQAECLMRRADHACFIGYSLPNDDLEVIDLLRRGLEHLPANAVTVIEYDHEEERQLGDHPVGRRYRSLFGEGINWYTKGFSDWVQHVGAQRKKVASVSANVP